MRRRRQAGGPRVSGGRDRAVRELPVDEVAPGVLVATAETYTTTTTVVVGDDGRCLLVDPAVSVADLAGLARWLGERGLSPAAGWSTHPHWDHLLWSRALGDVPRYATPRPAAVAARDRTALAAAVQYEAPGHDLALFARVEALPGGVSAVIPGHGRPGDAAEFRRRLAADLAYLDAVAAGIDYPDPRLTEDWLRTEHARALALARARPG